MHKTLKTDEISSLFNQGWNIAVSDRNNCQRNVPIACLPPPPLQKKT